MKTFLLVVALFAFYYAHSQTVVWSEDFSTGGSGWTISSTEGTNDAAHNIGIVNNQGASGSSPSGENLLHVTCNTSDGFCSSMGGPGSVYNAGGITAITTAYSPDAAFTTPNSNICSGDCISFTDQSSGNIASWQWSFPGANPTNSTNQNPTSICYSMAGNYKAFLTVTDASNVSSIDSLSIVVNPITNAVITANPSQGQIPLVVNLSTIAPANECNWLVDGIYYNGVSAVNNTFLLPGNFEVCLFTQNSNGCKDTSCINIVALNVFPADTSFIDVPNIFTPNGDLKNDLFVTYSQNIDKWSAKIYNRWGNVMFESTQPNIQWNGYTGGNPAADGSYFYVISATGRDGKKYELYGNITLLR